MNLTEMEKVFLTRQSCRSYNPERTPSADVLKKIAEMAMLAPSACNSQPWGLIVTNEKETVSKIASTTHGLGMNKFADDCTAFAVITETIPSRVECAAAKLTGRDFVSNDLGIMCAHLVIAAESAGISSCIIGNFNEKKLKEFLNIPQKHTVALVVALGYAKDGDEIRKKKRKDISETCKFILE